VSQSKHSSAASQQDAVKVRGRESATTSEGIAGERAEFAARGRETSLVTRTARRLERAARADHRAG